MKRLRELLVVVDLDEAYTPKSAPTVLNCTELPHSLEHWEDPRLFVHHGDLYLVAVGYYTVYLSGGLQQMWDARQYLARLERLPSAANNATGATPAPPAGFQVAQLQQLLLPDEDVPSDLTLPADIDIRRPFREKNWVPFIYDDSIHFIYSLNPPVVIRVVADQPGADVNADIRTAFVSGGGDSTTVRWRHGVMRGGTPAIYDADIGGYVAFFHSHDRFRVPTQRGDKDVAFYFMGFYVFAPRPPFGIQLISEAPLLGPGFYNDSTHEAWRLRAVWPAGLMVQPDAFIVSYGKDDEAKPGGPDRPPQADGDPAGASASGVARTSVLMLSSTALSAYP